MAKSENNADSTSSTTKVFVVDKLVCNFIASEWFEPGKSDREHARQFGIHHNLIKKIKDKDGYKIPVSTLATICFYKGVTLEDFFASISTKYGDTINDDFVEKFSS